MDLIFVDDSKQKKPSRPGMGHLVAVGGLHVPSEGVQALMKTLEETCTEYGFPSYKDEFKWSPGRRDWMRKNLVGNDRAEFFADCLEAAKEEGAEAFVVIEDKSRKSTDGNRDDHEMAAVKVFLERSDYHLRSNGTEALVIADHPAGGRKAEERFLSECVETLRDGTRFMDLENIAHVFTQDSKSTRLLQLADVIVGCTLSYVSGEDEHSPLLFENQIKGMLREEGGRKGGIGLKLHPDFSFANLYHWLLGDDTLWKGSMGEALPMRGRPYVNSPTDPSVIKTVTTEEGVITF
jgi:uncharacterized protein DUF3800